MEVIIIKNNFLCKQVLSWLLVITAMFGLSVPALAYDFNKNERSTAEENSIVEYSFIVKDDGEAVLYGSNTPVDGRIPRMSTATYYPTLSNYVGVTKEFSATTTSAGGSDPDGILHVYLTKPNGSQLAYWAMGTEDHVIKKFTLPPAGTYTLRVESQADCPVYFSATWVA